MPKCLKYQIVPKRVQKLGLGPAFITSDLFTLTSMVMSSIIMKVIHMYVSIAIKLSKHLTGLLCTLYLSWPENQGIYFLYISQIFQMNWISFMVAQVNAVLLIHWFCMGD